MLNGRQRIAWRKWLPAVLLAVGVLVSTAGAITPAPDAPPGVGPDPPPAGATGGCVQTRRRRHPAPRPRHRLQTLGGPRRVEARRRPPRRVQRRQPSPRRPRAPEAFRSPLAASSRRRKPSADVSPARSWLATVRGHRLGTVARAACCCRSHSSSPVCWRWSASSRSAAGGSTATRSRALTPILVGVGAYSDRQPGADADLVGVGRHGIRFRISNPDECRARKTFGDVFL